ncbi:MAG: GspH/FimT family pseudopilin, partial [Desulfobulbaceae bacterium]|nr:GspH/FimT family pseudopilin [Desulfobulbaceae bacterium]
NLSFRRQTNKIMATLRYARLVSVSRGQEVHVKLDQDNDTILQLSGAVEERKEFGLTENDHLKIEPEEIIFFPEGVATPAILTFTKGDRTRKITLELLTGLPSIT